MAINALGIAAVSSIAQNLDPADRTPLLLLGAMAPPGASNALFPLTFAQKRVVEKEAEDLRTDLRRSRARAQELQQERAAFVAFLQELEKQDDLAEVKRRIRLALGELTEEPGEDDPVRARARAFFEELLRFTGDLDRGGATNGRSARPLATPEPVPDDLVGAAASSGSTTTPQPRRAK